MQRSTKNRWLKISATTFLAVALTIGIALFLRYRNIGLPDARTLDAMHRLEKVWLSFPKRHAGKTEYGNACAALGGAVAKCTPEELTGIIHYNVSQFTDAPDKHRRNDFEIGYLAALDFICVDQLISNRDHEQLVYVLARVPRDRLGFACVEMTVGMDFRPQYEADDPWKADDLFTVLFDAFEKAETPGARASLLAAIQRSFRDQPGNPAGGSQYVTQCREWFTKNFNHLEAVRDHVYVYGDEPWTSVKPLFVVRETAASH